MSLRPETEKQVLDRAMERAKLAFRYAKTPYSRAKALRKIDELRGTTK